jgi:hypothetical protein
VFPRRWKAGRAIHVARERGDGEGFSLDATWIRIGEAEPDAPDRPRLAPVRLARTETLEGAADRMVQARALAVYVDACEGIDHDGDIARARRLHAELDPDAGPIDRSYDIRDGMSVAESSQPTRAHLNAIRGGRLISCQPDAAHWRGVFGFNVRVVPRDGSEPFDAELQGTRNGDRVTFRHIDNDGNVIEEMAPRTYDVAAVDVWVF